MKKLVDNYDLNTAPAINVPKVGHTIKGPNGIVSRSTKGIDNPRQLLAREIRELRRVYNDIPNSALKELIELNKKMSRNEEVKMNDIFVKSLYETIVKENLQLYKDLYETTNVNSKTDDYWKKAIGFYDSLTDENKDTLMKIIEQTMIDTISNMLGVIDGSSTLKDCSLEPKLLLDSIDTDGELQDSFLEFIEDRDSNS
ncbi:hypothetical protein [Aquibacillus kalidii]|uniref:hypothetical protein n=1 Tax=Aquibacillus kalidii TaxID=2762597 RepID=UPI001F430CE0|nr:hypothetical protein [Aquibacillus kalidii]